ncbi:hydroxymethylglutaryl-CoA lyase [Marinobacter pelagius]|uniref:hydroxymethylglutaryl-CoA lyase n=1 Tax=Marinobacter sp. C7 TaxID=2951363 RepID=UPI001EF0A8CE|nr:hydroxymethylglutaryl-CoA lyase [Marinobacter sp. C7]MCG7198712.1 hydroxymethylglutaryl-CoA lyase [Marinobacter sp. C7]
MSQISICDVALRDGLQSQKQFLTLHEKLEILGAMEHAGIREFELGSFVRPDKVPQMADTKDLFQLVSGNSESKFIGLAPNMKGFESALAVGAKKIAMVITCTDTLSRKNFGKNVEQVIDEIGKVLEEATRVNIEARVYVSGIFECPFEGAVSTDRVVEIVRRVAALSPSEICLADTTGAGNPSDAQRLFEEVLQVCDRERVSVHLHDTRGMALALAWVAFKQGIRKFDSSLGGLGGCPFAPGASGNVATEDLVVMFEQSGVSTGISISKLMDAVDCLEKYIKRPVGGKTVNWLKSQERK